MFVKVWSIGTAQNTEIIHMFHNEVQDLLGYGRMIYTANMATAGLVTRWWRAVKIRYNN